MTARSVGRARVEGIGFWGEGRPGWPSISGDAGIDATSTSHGRPVASVLGPTERRRAPDSVALAIDVAAQACRAAGRDPADLRSVFSSMHGDLGITDYLCSTLARDPTGLSPTRFHNSVHNAAAGYWTIGTGCHEPYTAIAAGEWTAGEGLLEALAQLACEQRPVLYVAYDIEARGALVAVSPSHGLLGFSMVLGPAEGASQGRLIEWNVVTGRAPTPIRTEVGVALAGNAMSPVIPLVEALADPVARSVCLGLTATLGLELRLLD
ncbi:MAG: beta-ketoacyl synthase chain length factor [Steroidobacteraceae bacterium]